jgi:hypothetical protein
MKISRGGQLLGGVAGVRKRKKGEQAKDMQEELNQRK